MKYRDEKTFEDRKSSDVRIHRTTSPDGTEIAGLGHMAPELGSKAVAEAIAGFFTEKL